MVKSKRRGEQLKLFANVIPVQRLPIPWGWKNVKTDAGVFAANPPGAIKMPDLCRHFNWSEYIVEGMGKDLPFGTRNMKSIFITASRFLSWEDLLINSPDLSSITRVFLEWNARLCDVWDGRLQYFMIGDDIAWNNGLLINPDWFRSWILPEHKKLIDFAKSRGMKVIFHSDGDLYNVLDDYANAGVDVLYYQSVGKMKTLESLHAVSPRAGWNGRLWKDMLCIENDDPDHPNLNMLRLQLGEQK